MSAEVVPMSEGRAVQTLSPEAERFALRQRQARMFAFSPLVPDHLRKGTEEQALANCYIALTLAEAMGEVPLVVMQNIHIVNGKAGFATQYMIARANAAGIFKGRIDWRIDRSDKANLTVTAFAVLKETGQEISLSVDMAMAKAEGWTKNPKYTSMPEVMLRYRSAAFLVRFYAPDVMLGYQSTEEIEDVGIARGPDLSAVPLSATMLIEQAAPAEIAAVQEAIHERVDEETGEIMTGEALERDPATGMTVVDEETARALDAGADATGGEAHAALDPQSIDQAPAEPEAAPHWQAAVDKALGGIRAAKNLAYLTSVEDAWLGARAGVSDPSVQKRVDDMIDAARRELRAKAGDGLL